MKVQSGLSLPGRYQAGNLESKKVEGKFTGK
jgi:hypothetical protein